MENPPLTNLRKASFLGLFIALVIIAVMLGVLLAMLVQASQSVDLASRRTIARMAWWCLMVLGITLLLLVWLAVRFIAFRLHPTEAAKPTQYVDSWSLAGKRFNLPQDDSDHGPDDENKQEGKG